MSKLFLIVTGLAVLLGVGLFWLGGAAAGSATFKEAESLMNDKPETAEIATLAGGCFWCLESEVRAKDGVLYTVSGYIGGRIENPTYQQITTGKTGHAEAVEIHYDPNKVTYEELARLFLTEWHDPTQLNRQGVDVGPQYRSAIFTHNAEQEETARRLIDEINQSERWNDEIVTEITPAPEFFPAEEYHQQYYKKYEERTGKPHIRVLMKKIK